MKAIRIHQYGTPDEMRYEEVPCPEPAANEVLVNVHAAGINPADWKTRAGGGMAFHLHNPFPMIPGWDVSGVVGAVGSAVTRFKVGDPVFGMVHFPDVGSTYAEYCAIPEQHLSHKPDNVDHVHAAAIPLAALTAWQALFEHANLQAGQRLLVHGASGGVGHLAVQLAKAKGAHVIGTASPANLDFLRTLGLDQVVDYTTADFEETISPVDMVLDTVGGERQKQLFTLIRDGGSFVSIAGAPDPMQSEKQHLRASGMLVHIDPLHLDQIAGLMAANCLSADIAQVFPLAEAAQAHRFGETRSARRGKLVLQVR